MDQLKERKAPEIEDGDLEKITEAYRQMTPTNRYFIMSASGMLLASQRAGEEEKGQETGK